MSLIVVGINHKTAQLLVREKFSFTTKQIGEYLTKLHTSNFLLDAVILSTCNRSEIYVSLPPEKSHLSLLQIKSFIFDIYAASENKRERYFYILEGVDAIRHLFRVASGLDSQVLGETQILGQVRSAWLAAYDKGTTNDTLDGIFKKAQDVGRIVRSQTMISQGNVSIGSVAINMLEERFPDLKERSVLIIGAGKIGALVSKYLREKNMRGIFVANRTYARALELAKSCTGKVVDFYGLEQELRGVDIVISSTASPHIVLKKEALAEIMPTRTKPLFIMDLALPRDVDPRVKEITGVSLCDLDDLKCVIGGNQKKKEAEAIIAEKIVERELNNFLNMANPLESYNSVAIKIDCVNLRICHPKIFSKSRS